MKALKITFVSFALVFVLVLPGLAQSGIGQIVYLEEDVEIDRNKETIPPWDVFIGMEIENYDLVRTNERGYAEVEVDDPRSAPAIVKISPNTTFYFEMLFRQVPVSISDLETFRGEWYADRLEVFKSNALKAIKFYALRYIRLKRRFDSAYTELQRESQILRKWHEEDRRGEIGGRMESLREKKQLIGELLELRKILYIFERVYFRLVELEGYFRQGYGRGQIEPGLAAGAFFNRFTREKRQLAAKMAEIRYITKLYAKRNDGVFPTDLFEQGEEDFFGDTEGFFGEEGDTSF